MNPLSVHVVLLTRLVAAVHYNAQQQQQQDIVTSADQLPHLGSHAKERTLVSYAYFEGRSGAVENLKAYIEIGVRSQPVSAPIVYAFVINGGKCTASIPSRKDIIVFSRENTGYDFGAHFDLLRHIAGQRVIPNSPEGPDPMRRKAAGDRTLFSSSTLINASAMLPFDKFIFLNAGVRGPFLPAYWPRTMSWTHAYTDKLSQRVKLVGNSIVCLPPNDPCVVGIPNMGFPPNPQCLGPKVEGYAWATDAVGLQVLMDAGSVFQVHPNKLSAILCGEYGMTQAMQRANYTMDSLLLAYQDWDWTDTKNWNCNNKVHPSHIKSYFGISQNPLETIFAKTEWVYEGGAIERINPELINKYTIFKEHLTHTLENPAAEQENMARWQQSLTRWFKKPYQAVE